MSFPSSSPSPNTGRAAHPELRAAALWMESLQAANTAVALTVLQEGRSIIVLVNPAFERLTGYAAAEAMGRSQRELLSSAEAAAEWRRLDVSAEQGTSLRRVLTGATRSGQPFYVSVEAFPLRLEGKATPYWVQVFADVSALLQQTQDERRVLDARLIEARQLESLGTLAGGVAHDFNNLLTIMLGYASLLNDAAGDPARLAHYAAIIIEAGRRGADVVRQLQLFANQHEADLMPMNVHALIDDVLERMRPSWPEQVVVQREYGADDPVIPLDPGHIAQGLVHLLQNACNAMPSGGLLRLRTAEVTQPAPDGAPGVAAYLQVTVEDTGRGMDTETCQRMFEPFFAKNRGPEARGLGMAVVYGIMRTHRGQISVDSTPGQGTRVHLLFPRTEHGHTANPFGGQGVKRTPPIPPPSKKARTILLIENEPDLGSLCLQVLEGENWPVLWAVNGEEALHLFRANREHIGLVFTDIGLPGIDGWTVATRIRAEAPHMPLLVASGAFKSGDKREARLAEPVSYLPKPYAPETIRLRIRALLQEEPGPEPSA